MSQEKPVIELVNIHKSFNRKEVLRGFSLTVAAGEKLSLVGESSAGKSTLLKIAVGLVPPDHGTVKLFGQDISKLGSSDLRKVRQRVGMQFQSGALFDSMSVMENLLLARRESARDHKALVEAENTQEPMRLLAAVGLASSAGKKPFELSGGMRKRAALARALTTAPDLAIFDEPTAGLDPVTSRRIINLVQAASARSGAAMILATTDIEVARHFSPNLLVLNEGRLWANDTFDNLRSSSDPFVQKMLSRLIS